MKYVEIVKLFDNQDLLLHDPPSRRAATDLLEQCHRPVLRETVETDGRLFYCADLLLIDNTKIEVEHKSCWTGATGYQICGKQETHIHLLPRKVFKWQYPEHPDVYFIFNKYFDRCLILPQSTALQFKDETITGEFTFGRETRVLVPVSSASFYRLDFLTKKWTNECK